MNLEELSAKHAREQEDLVSNQAGWKLGLARKLEAERLAFLEACEREQHELPAKIEQRRRELITQKEEASQRAQEERSLLQRRIAQAELELPTIHFAIERKYKEQDLAQLRAGIVDIDQRLQTALRDLDKTLQGLHGSPEFDLASLETAQVEKYKRLLQDHEEQRRRLDSNHADARKRLTDAQRAEFIAIEVLERLASTEHVIYKENVVAQKLREERTWGVALRRFEFVISFEVHCSHALFAINAESNNQERFFWVRQESQRYRRKYKEDVIYVPGKDEVSKANLLQALLQIIEAAESNHKVAMRPPDCSYDDGECSTFNSLGVAHPADVCGRSLDVRQVNDFIGSKWGPSRHLRTLNLTGGVALYHSIRGNLRFASHSFLEFLDEARRGTALEEIEARFPHVAVKDEIQEMVRLGFLTLDDHEPQIVISPPGIDLGSRVRWLRLNTAVDCNLACTYCHGINEMKPCAESRMPVETALRAVHLFCNLLLEHDVKFMQIRYFGGEPLLNRRAVLSSMALAQELSVQHGLHLSVLLNTNATLITPRLAQELATHRDHLTAIVSLDGPLTAHNSARIYRNGRGSFDSVLRGLDILQQANIRTNISATFGDHNQDQLRSLVDLLLDRDIHYMGLDPIRMVTKSDDPMRLAEALLDVVAYGESMGFEIGGMWKGVIDRLEHGSFGAFCGGSGTELSVLPSGEIYPCQSQPVLLGTLNDLESRALFAGDAYRYVSGRVAGNLPDCQGCEIEGLCAGGCAADACAMSGNLYGRTQFCEFNKVLVQHYLTQAASDMTL